MTDETRAFLARQEEWARVVGRHDFADWAAAHSKHYETDEALKKSKQERISFKIYRTERIQFLSKKRAMK